MVDWSKAEKPLIEDAEGDAVVIFDACYSSNLMKNTRSGEPRSYELLAAVGHDQATAGPGPKSFTTAMIRSLEELLEECHRRPFTVRQLCERINLRIERRHNPSHVWSRLQCFERNIALGPLKDPGAGKNERFPPEQTRALLSLSFPLTEERLSEQQILTLAKALSQAVKKNNLPVRRIDWTTLRGSATLADMDKVTEITDSGLRWKHAYLAVSTALGWKNLSMANRHSGLPTSAEDSVPQAINDMVAQTLGDSHTQEPLPIGLTTSSPLPAPKSRKRKQREQKSASNFVRKLRRLHDLKQIEARRE